MVVKQLWGEERVTLEHPDGSLVSVPINWTDAAPADPYLELGCGRSLFRVEDLVALAQLIGARNQRGPRQ